MNATLATNVERAIESSDISMTENLMRNQKGNLKNGLGFQSQLHESREQEVLVEMRASRGGAEVVAKKKGLQTMGFSFRLIFLLVVVAFLASFSGDCI